jgi:hypothetical protein
MCLFLTFSDHKLVLHTRQPSHMSVCMSRDACHVHVPVAHVKSPRCVFMFVTKSGGFGADVDAAALTHDRPCTYVCALQTEQHTQAISIARHEATVAISAATP